MDSLQHNFYMRTHTDDECGFVADLEGGWTFLTFCVRSSARILRGPRPVRVPHQGAAMMITLPAEHARDAVSSGLVSCDVSRLMFVAGACIRFPFCFGFRWWFPENCPSVQGSCFNCVALGRSQYWVL